MQKVCANSWCKTSFEILDADREMAQNFDMEWNPIECPSCRHIRRGMFSSELILHRRKSGLSGEPIISIFSDQKPFPVYSITEWWGDMWDPLQYGRPMNFSEPFFMQFEELFNEVPKMANFNENCENCEYSAGAGSSKNAYYCSTAYFSEDVYYCEAVTGFNTDLVDCLRCQKSSQLWECVQCIDCHLSSFLFRCFTSRDSHFCIDCRGCNDCLLCCNLRNKSYHVGNRPVAKEEFLKIKAEMIDGRWSTLQKNLQKFANIRLQAIWPNVMQMNCENCIGDQLFNSADCFQCYNCFNCHGNRYCWELTPSKQCVSWMEITRGGIGELVYNSASVGGGNYYLRMCSRCRLSSDLTYCIDCYSCKNCFGCTGLKSQQYCILNKQYTRDEYEKLVAKITTHMKAADDWGKFFPISISPFAYSESSSMRYMPLTKEEVLSRGWQWADLPDLHQEESGTKEPLPDALDDVTEAICQKILFCEVTGRKYKILPQELKYYRAWRSPLPRHHPDVRMQRRQKMINPYRLWTRSCMKCGKEMETSFSPERPEIVYCEKCYLEAVY